MAHRHPCHRHGRGKHQVVLQGRVEIDGTCGGAGQRTNVRRATSQNLPAPLPGTTHERVIVQIGLRPPLEHLDAVRLTLPVGPRPPEARRGDEEEVLRPARPRPATMSVSPTAVDWWMCPPSTTSAPASRRASSTVSRCFNGTFRIARQGAPARWWWRATTRRAPAGAEANASRTASSAGAGSLPPWCRHGRVESRPCTTIPVAANRGLRGPISRSNTAPGAVNRAGTV